MSRLRSAGLGERVAALLLLSGLGVALFSHLAGMLPDFMGLWQDSESIFLALQAGCLLLALGLAVAGGSAPGEVLADLSHPLVLLTLALAGWSMVGAFGAADPSMALLGLPQTGDGTVLFLNSAVMIAATLHVRRTPALARGAGVLVAVSAALIPLLSLSERTQVYFFGAWISYLALAAPPVLMILLEGWLPRGRGVVLGLALGGLGLVATGSKTALGAGLLGIVALLLLWRPWSWLEHGRWVTPRRLAFIVATWAILLLIGTQIVGNDRTFESIWSRVHLQRALLADLLDQPWAWILGEGWGQIRDEFTRGLPAAGVPLWWADKWDMLQRDVVNSHNALIEALLAGGVPGLGLRLLLMVALPVFAPPGRRGGATFLALTLATLGGLWFQVPGTVAIVAVAYGTVADPREALLLTSLRQRVLGSAVRLLLVLSALGQGAVIGTLVADGMAVFRLDREIFSGKPVAEAPGCLPPALAGWRRVIYFSEILGKSLRSVRVGPEADRIPPAPETLRQLLCTADRPEFRSLAALGMFALVLRGDLILSAPDSPYRALGNTLIEGWESRLRAHLVRAPRRIDAFIDYFSWLYKQERYLQMLAVAGRMLAETPDNSIAHWYSGAALMRLGTPERVALARQHFRRALALNVDLFLRISDEDRVWILRQE